MVTLERLDRVLQLDVSVFSGRMGRSSSPCTDVPTCRLCRGG